MSCAIRKQGKHVNELIHKDGLTYYAFRSYMRALRIAIKNEGENEIILRDEWDFRADSLSIVNVVLSKEANEGCFFTCAKQAQHSKLWASKTANILLVR